MEIGVSRTASQEEIQRAYRKLRNHIRQIQALGFEVTLTKTP